jgi:hypothetical protein
MIWAPGVGAKRLHVRTALAEYRQSSATAIEVFWEQGHLAGDEYIECETTTLGSTCRDLPQGFLR